MSMAGNGFTLIELLVVLVIIGLILSVAPAAFHRMLPGAQHQAIARELVAVLRDARGRAIQQNRQVAVIVDVNDRTMESGEGELLARFGDDLTLSIVAGRSEQLDEDRARIRFFPDGTSTGGRITMASDRREYHLLVDWLTGRVAFAD